MVTVVVACYNQESTINRCIDSILSQKADFEINILIGDDCSQDNTSNIVQNYANEYDNITCCVRKTNLGPCDNYMELCKQVKTPYIACLEGDDYWIHPKKLQYQISALENNPNVSLCYTEYAVEKNGVIHHNHSIRSKNKYTTRDILFVDPPHSSTVVIRTEVLLSLPKSLHDLYLMDTAIHAWASLQGHIHKLHFISSIWTNSTQGIWNSLSNAEKNEKKFLCHERLKSLSNEKWYKNLWQDASSHLKLRTRLSLTKNNDEIISINQRLLDIYPDDYYRRIHLTRVLINSRRDSEAQEQIKILKKIISDFPDLIQLEAKFLKLVGSPEKAIELLENCKEQFPKYNRADSDLFNLLLNMGKTKEAETFLKSTNWSLPARRDINKAKLSLRNNDPMSALDCLQNISTKNFPQVLFLKATCYYRIGDNIKAAQLVEEYLKIKPQHKPAIALMKKIKQK